MINTSGSMWNKWDLHLHTPFTKLSNNYDPIGREELWTTYCKKIEKSDVLAFGITDYFSVENYFIFIETHKRLYPDSKKVFFPNIEFRLDVSVNKAGEEVNIHIIFSDKTPKSQIAEFLTKLDTNITRQYRIISCNNLVGDDFKTACIKYSELRDLLFGVFGSNKCYVIIAASNNAGLRADTKSSRKVNITDEIDKVCDGFFGGQQNVEYYLGLDRYESGEASIPKPVIGGSDCHSFVDIDNFLGKRFVRDQGEKKIIEKDITWVKAETTFEGLMQIFHEPEHRIYIGENHPREPIRKINSVHFRFPDNIRIKRKDSTEYQELCIQKINNKLDFNPYFTCLIGGRGTGKSTIINLIAERLKNNTDFFSPSQNSLFVKEHESFTYDIKEDKDSFITIDGTNDIEFVSQGRVEKLTEGDELTKLIFEERILLTNSSLQELKQKIGNILSLIKDQIDLVLSLNDTKTEIQQKEDERLVYESIISSITDPKYSDITNSIKDLSDKKNAIDTSKLKYTDLIDKIKNILLETTIEEKDNDYEKRVNIIIDYLLQLSEFEEKEKVITVNYIDDTNTNLLIRDLETQLHSKQTELSRFFEEKGTSEESIKDSQAANEKLSLVEQRLRDLDEKMRLASHRFNENHKIITALSSIDESVKEIIETSISDLNSKLDMQNENVAKISYTFTFDDEKYLHNLKEDFYTVFKKYHISGTSWDSVHDTLFTTIKPDSNLLSLNYKDFVQVLNDGIPTRNKNTNYVTVLLTIFSDETNYIIYQYLIYKHIFNAFNYISIIGFYGDRQLKSCSFGQKCTAVMVTLLMTGVKPLIIDEPEAHLDNKLIADYLVDLIKEKKSDRQIIFATHNANFVINGDSELIYILEVPEKDNFTVLTNSTIENLRNRDKLLKLEGGRIAFEKREKKLMNIS